METDIINMLLGLTRDDLNTIRERYGAPEPDFIAAIESARSYVSFHYGNEFILIHDEDGLITGMTRIESSLTNEESGLATSMATIG